MPYNTWTAEREAPRPRRTTSKAAMSCGKKKGDGTPRPVSVPDRIVSRTGSCPMCKQLLSPKDIGGHLLSIHCQIFAHDVEGKALAKRAETFRGVECLGADLTDLSEGDTEPAGHGPFTHASQQHLPWSSAASDRQATERPALKISCKNRYKTWPGGDDRDKRLSDSGGERAELHRNKSVSWFTPVLAKDLPGSRLAKDIGVSPKQVGSVSPKEDGASGLNSLANMPGMPMLKIPLRFPNNEVMGWRLENIFRV